MKHGDLIVRQIVEECEKREGCMESPVACPLIGFCNVAGLRIVKGINPDRWNEGNLLDKKVDLELKNIKPINGTIEVLDRIEKKIDKTLIYINESMVGMSFLRTDNEN